MNSNPHSGVRCLIKQRPPRCGMTCAHLYANYMYVCKWRAQRYTFKAAVTADIGRRNALMQPRISVTVIHTSYPFPARPACYGVVLSRVHRPSFSSLSRFLSPSQRRGLALSPCSRSSLFPLTSPIGEGNPPCRLSLPLLFIVSWLLVTFTFVLCPPQSLPHSFFNPLGCTFAIDSRVGLSLSLSSSLPPVFVAQPPRC